VVALDIAIAESRFSLGSIYAILTTFACLAPRAQILFFFVIPAPAWVIVPGIIGYDVYSAWFQPGGLTDSAGHIGGAAAGAVFYALVLRRGRGWYKH
jgi:rhomboid-like protein